jgi:hypothetical protein
MILEFSDKEYTDTGVIKTDPKTKLSFAFVI